jgi:2,3-bisphosphoglycerate-independent phosphoglycerate mutase
MTKENLVRKIKEQMDVTKGLNSEIETLEKIIGATDSLTMNFDTFDNVDETYSYEHLIRVIEILDNITKILADALNAYLGCFNSHTAEVLKCKEVNKDER